MNVQWMNYGRWEKIYKPFHEKCNNYINIFTAILVVRQLEAIIRIAESLAKMRLKPFASEEDVDEALRLFQVSTLDAARTGNLSGNHISPCTYPILGLSLLFFVFVNIVSHWCEGTISWWFGNQKISVAMVCQVFRHSQLKRMRDPTLATFVPGFTLSENFV